MRLPVARTAGFTLVELLIVVALLSAVSLMVFSGLAEDRVQIRYDDTKTRLQIVRRAILGQNGPSTAEAAAGFIADNGAMPTDLVTLIQPGALLERAVQSPLFDPKPDDASCANDGGETTLTYPAAQLVKGHRGDYLGGLSFNGTFRDGWGNQSASDDTSNFGWSVAFDDSSKALSLASLGTDNAAGGSDFAADIGLTVAAADWLLPLGGWTVTIRNSRSQDIPANQLSLSLLVFVNGTGGGQWLRYATSPLATCLGTGIGCTTSATLAFTDGCKPGVVISGQGRLPQGRHLLALTWNGSDATPWTADDALTQATYLPTAVFAQIDAVAGRNLPALTLDIR